MLVPYAQTLDRLNPRDFIIIEGAKTHNLKNISVAIPRNQLVVVTGLSGSGKSSLIVDTLFVEAQRMYLESLSAYARQFLGKMQKPAVESIRGVSPAIAIQQNVAHKNPRSTVGTATELCDYLNLLYARIGATYSPISGQMVKKDTVSDVVDCICRQDEDTKVLILYPMNVKNKEMFLQQLAVELGKGFTRVMQHHRLYFIESLLEGKEQLELDQPVYGVVDRIVVQKGEQAQQARIADSVQIAFFEGRGEMVVEGMEGGQKRFSDRFDLDGIHFEWPTIQFFNFNTPYGACKSCEGLGQRIGIDEKKVIPNPILSVAAGAIAPWNGPIVSKWLAPLISLASSWSFPIHTPYNQLTPAHKKLLWEGQGDFIGIYPFFDFCVTQTDKMHYRILLARYRGKTNCTACQGTRVRPDAHYVKINRRSIVDLLLMPVQELLIFFENLFLTDYQENISSRIVKEIINRLRYLVTAGLGYLTLGRAVATLSGGEYQRIRLATALGSPLFGTIYILDEPTAGLHPRDTDRLVELLVNLKNHGNTVIVIEHEERVMRAADTLIEIGPGAGAKGGSLVFQGSFAELLQFQSTHTAQYLTGVVSIPWNKQRRLGRNHLRIEGATLHNLKAVTVEIPLNVLTVVTGVSGSGKSSLVKEILYPALQRHCECKVMWGKERKEEEEVKLEGDLHCIRGVELVSQHPLGKSSRSNPATYLDLYDPIRSLFVETELSSSRNYQMGHFSFNSEKGQCPRCRGEGEQKIEMQFMADIYLPCELCRGSRFKPEILEVTFCDKNIAEILRMTVEEAAGFFINYAVILHKLNTLQQVGLGYLPLGQTSASLSGGERQRLKLAYYLEKNLSDHPLFFIFDEPTTGLHMHDVHKLLMAIQGLIAQGHTVLVIEHNMDVVQSADWVIDLGPESGAQGGKVIFTGTPEELIELEGNYTAHYLKQKMKKVFA